MRTVRIAHRRVAARLFALATATALVLAGCGAVTAPQVGSGAGTGRLVPRATSSPTTASTALAEREFWSIIASTRSSRSTAERAQVLQGRLRTLPPSQIADFDRELTEAVNTIGSTRHLEAAEVMMGFTPPAAFVDFRAWVVAQGEHVHSKFAEEPDSLADAGLDREGELVAGEMVALAPAQAYRTVTGRSLDEDFPDLPKPLVLGTAAGDRSYAALAIDLPRLAAVYLPHPIPPGNAFTGGPRGIEPQR